ncbi:TraB/GumN family protein [Halocynthiibacter namhaensis]|uniref:TraB/GumN family protein n=1 Tax=Halocynthiibacter namhaensis TaxID=1290553 RepID=UPI003B510AED
MLLPAVENGRYLVAVGAGHFSGETGVLNLLQQNDYSLTRLDQSDCTGATPPHCARPSTPLGVSAYMPFSTFSNQP